MPIALALVIVLSAVLWWSGRDRAQRAPGYLERWGSTSADQDHSENRLRVARCMARVAVVHELLARRLSVIEAAAVFGWLDRQPPELRNSDQMYAALSFLRDDPEGAKLVNEAAVREEWLCLHVTNYAIDVARSDLPGQADRLAAELDAELRREWAAGRVRSLPAVNEVACRMLLERSLAGVAAFTRLGPVPPIPASDLRLIVRE